MRCLLVVPVLLMLAAGDEAPQRRVLILGDSLVGDNSGLEAGLRKRLEEQGASVKTHWEVGARVSTWVGDQDVAELIQWADSIIVVLGMNSSRTPPKTYGRFVREFDEEVIGASIECFWIGPPALVEGTEDFVRKMNKTVKKNSRCAYFNTFKLMEFNDNSITGFHVRPWKGKRWARNVWKWMQIGEE